MSLRPYLRHLRIKPRSQTAAEAVHLPAGGFVEPVAEGGEAVAGALQGAQVEAVLVARLDEDGQTGFVEGGAGAPGVGGAGDEQHLLPAALTCQRADGE